MTPILARLPPASDRPNRFRLVLTGADRAQVVFLQTALVQYPDRIEALLVIPKPAADFSYDWNLGRVQLSFGMGKPGLQVLNQYGKVVERWSGFVSPGELGLILRRNLGVPAPFAAARNRSDKLNGMEKNFSRADDARAWFLQGFKGMFR